MDISKIRSEELAAVSRWGIFFLSCRRMIQHGFFSVRFVFCHVRAKTDSALAAADLFLVGSADKSPEWDNPHDKSGKDKNISYARHWGIIAKKFRDATFRREGLGFRAQFDFDFLQFLF